MVNKPSSGDKQDRKVSTPKGKSKIEIKEKNIKENNNLSRTLTTKGNKNGLKTSDKKEKEEKIKEDKEKKEKAKKEKEETISSEPKKKIEATQENKDQSI